MKTMTFHSNFQRVTVCVDGMPVSLNAEVEVTLKRPNKLDSTSEKAWDAITDKHKTEVTVEHCPAGKPV
jgi:hypothetical protein